LLSDNANIIEAVRLYHLGETGTTEYPSADSISGHLNTKANISGQVFTGNITATNVTATANLSVGNNLVVTSNFTAGNISVANITSSGNVTASGNLTVQGNAYIDDTFAQKVIDAGTTYNSTVNAYTVDFALGSYFSNIALQRQTGTWTFVGSNAITFAGTSTVFNYGPVQVGDLVVLTIGTDGIANPSITGSTGWLPAITTGANTVNASVFYKQITSTSQSNVTIIPSNGISANFAASAAIFRNSKINVLGAGTYIRYIAKEQSTVRIDTSSTSITGASMTTIGSNNLTVLSLYGGDGTWTMTSIPTGYSGGMKTSNTAAAVSAATAYDLSSTANTAVATNWVVSSFSGEYASFALEFSAEVNPIIVVSNATALSSTDYKASAYVVDVRNSNTAPATNLSWSGINQKWAYGYEIKPGTSLTYRDTIYMFQTKDGGSTFRAAALVGYA
jgi:cytoskeletal protein CcmA (bactofilin family)